MGSEPIRKLFQFVTLQLALVAMGGALASASAQQQSTLDVVKKRGTLIAGVKSDFPPFGYIDEKGNQVGFDIEIVQYIAKKLGVAVELRPVTSANRIPMLQSQTVDLLAASLSITRERVEAIDFSVPYIVIGSKFLVKKGSGIRGYADLAGKDRRLYAGYSMGRNAQEVAAAGDSARVPG
jgi:polar amino acid transport system substrate-binding protein